MGNNQPSARKKTYYISLAILAGMFFIFGFVSWVNSILIPYFRISCELTHFESYFVAFAFYIAYFVMAIPSGMHSNEEKRNHVWLYADCFGSLYLCPGSSGTAI